MKVSMDTATQGNPLRVRVEANEVHLSPETLDKAIKTLQLARRWLAEQKKDKA